MRISVTLLQYEHGIVRQTIDVLAEVVKGGRAPERKADVEELMSFLLDYLDRFHHAKEEECFFPQVVNYFPQFKEDVDGIYDDHVEARELLEAGIKALDEEDWETFNSLSMKVVHHMTAHVEKEENNIFPTVDEDLPLEVDEAMNQCYQDFLRNFGEDYYQKAEMFANEIQDRLLGPGFFDKGIY